MTVSVWVTHLRSCNKLENCWYSAFCPTLCTYIDDLTYGHPHTNQSRVNSQFSTFFPESKWWCDLPTKPSLASLLVWLDTLFVTSPRSSFHHISNVPSIFWFPVQSSSSFCVWIFWMLEQALRTNILVEQPCDIWAMLLEKYLRQMTIVTLPLCHYTYSIRHCTVSAFLTVTYTCQQTKESGRLANEVKVRNITFSFFITILSVDFFFFIATRISLVEAYIATLFSFHLLLSHNSSFLLLLNEHPHITPDAHPPFTRPDPETELSMSQKWSSRWFF